MILTILGLAVWSGSHLFKRLAPEARAAMGDRGKGLVALLSLAGIVLMVIGYRGWDGAFLWNRAAWMTGVNNLVMLVSVYLFAASGMKTAVARRFRHPQLTGVILSSAAHLLVNGDVPSLVLFGGLALWAIVSIVLINRAEPRWTPPAAAPNAGKEAGAAIGAVVVTVALGYAHIWFGLSPFGG